jgi:hypothetical protein
MRRTLGSALVTVALCCAIGDASAENRVLPPESSRSILRALDPLGLDTEIHGGWTLSDVEVQRDSAELILGGPHPAKLVLVDLEEALPNPSVSLGETRSFRVGLVSSKRPSEGLETASKRLFSILKQSDKGAFYRSLEGDAPKPGAPSASGSEPMVAPAIPVSWTLGFGWALCLLLFIAALRAAPRATLRAHLPDLSIATGISALAGVTRALMSPMTLLHENTRGPRDLEAIAELAPLLRPMGGSLGVQRIVAQLGVEPSVASWAWTNLLWSSLTVGAVYGLLRALRVERLPSVAGAVTLATLPLAIRISGCEDAFPGSVAHLVLGVLAAALAARTGRMTWLGLSAVLLALAGVFRPSQYAAAGVFLPWALWLAAPTERSRLWNWRGLALVCIAWAVIVFPDVGAMLSDRSGSSALTIGWWSRPGIHSWPLFDPEVSPVWWMPLAALGLVVAVRNPSTRAAALGLLAYGFAMSFLLSCDYGWPSSLRRALSQAWIPPVLIGLGFGALLRDRARTLAAAAVVALSLTTLWSHGEWVETRYGQQRAIDAQQAQVLPHLLAQPPGLIITPWPTLDELSGTLLTLPLREAGWRIASLDEGERALKDREPSQPVYWYRSIACWARKVRGGRSEPGLHPRCEAMERSASWRPALLFEVPAVSDSDSLVLGAPGEHIELGLFTIERP